MSILLTGATGFLGSYLLKGILIKEKDKNIYILIRSKNYQSAVNRVYKEILPLFPANEQDSMFKRIQIICGDICQKRFGLSPTSYDELARKVSHVIHSAANTDFNASLSESRKINVQGTKNILDFGLHVSSLGRGIRIEHISTAYVAGLRSGTFSEYDYLNPTRFSNNYERSKFEAERLIEAYRPLIPVNIIRPSIIVGDSKTGFTKNFNVLYFPLKILAKRLIKRVPCRKRALLNLVPIDYVADAILIIVRDPLAENANFHLVANSRNQITIAQLLNDFAKWFNLPKLRIISPLLFNMILKIRFLRKSIPSEIRDVYNLAKPYKPYLFEGKLQIRGDATAAYLEERGLSQPDWENYQKNIFGYCEKSGWGKKLVGSHHSLVSC